ncbi:MULTISPECIES: GIY-YIG nuclease family protein [unclassified Streptococcus]|uniref:GIY-YIG nuclease family protein n=1 Tax=unclassified Streptococcus TaxID=2608887 RepID=UPI0010717D10|nr:MULTISPECIES: GIY-YIG nuclease family protein [unclassified Streptococcus]MBF0786760.1 GIY-YIG nuclease family protein [Streptococcus sp. 19428wC2_LYSM12]MCQ9210997.1 GIY-YIG nuclease family protein [Streptococcus sp. B01]MCQ9214270.1 GIY-YIG nuclease family protein [Streptococcus sp. O1]TFV06380.1 GIY-YIG nuclease family protein [Streptococcus sp. LYSM12]
MYVVRCADDSLYTGYTNDLDKRLATHNSGKGAKYTRIQSRRPVELLYHETFLDKSSAMSAEALFKRKTRQQKLDYITKNLTPDKE